MAEILNHTDKLWTAITNVKGDTNIAYTIKSSNPVETDEEFKFEVSEDIVQDPNNTVEIKEWDEDLYNEEDKGPYPKEIKSEKDWLLTKDII